MDSRVIAIYLDTPALAATLRRALDAGARIEALPEEISMACWLRVRITK